MVAISFKEFSDVETFRREASPLLQQNVTLNTACLSEVPLIQDDSQGVYQAIVTCKECSQEHSCVVVSAGKTVNTHKLMVSEGLCQHMAGDIAQQLQARAYGFTSLTAVAQVAELLADKLGFTCKHISDIMVLSSADTHSHIAVKSANAAAASIIASDYSSAQQEGTALSRKRSTTTGTDSLAASAASATASNNQIAQQA